MTDEHKYTPGPWTTDVALGDDRYGNVLAVGGPCGKFVCRFERPNGEADGTLIAAAPDLLEALEEMRYAKTDKADAMADAAIAKALGNDG